MFFYNQIINIIILKDNHKESVYNYQNKIQMPTFYFIVVRKKENKHRL